MSYAAIIWKEWIVFKSKFLSITLGMIVGPLLYLIAFGWGIGDKISIEGLSYTAFVIPGIIAMNSMTTGFGVIANDINLSRIYAKTFEAVMVAPMKMSVFTLARISANTLRCLYGAALIILVSLPFHTGLRIDGYFILVLILNSMVFSTIGFIAGILIDSHADMAKVTNFIITPMTFLCGTVFPLDRFPAVLRYIFEALPLTQTVSGLRQGYNSPRSLIVPLVLIVYLAVLIPVSIKLCKRAE